MKLFEMLIASLVAFFFTRVASAVAGANAEERRRQREKEPRRRHMVRCDVCGVYVLEERALMGGRETIYCSERCQSRVGS